MTINTSTWRTHGFAIVAAIGCALPLCALALSGCAGPPTAQVSGDQVNVLVASDVPLPGSLRQQIMADTGLEPQITSVPATKLSATLQAAPAGKFDAVLGLDLIDLGHVGSKLLDYSAIGAGKGATDFAPAFGNNATAITYTAICVNYTRGESAPTKFTDFVGSKYKGSVTVTRDNVYRAWSTAMANTMTKSWWAKFQTNFAPAESSTATPFRVSPVAAVTASDESQLAGSCVRWVRYAAVIKAGSHINNAMKLTDELLTPNVQRKLAIATDTFPVTKQTKMPKLTTNLDKATLVPINNQDVAGSLQDTD